MRKSWVQPYVDDHLMRESNGVQLTSAAIIAAPHGHVFAESAKFPRLTSHQRDEFLEEFRDPGKYAQKGLRIGGTRYNVIEGEHRDVIRGMRGTRRITVKKTFKLLLFGIHNQSMTHEQCTEILEETANLLIKKGY